MTRYRDLIAWLIGDPPSHSDLDAYNRDIGPPLSSHIRRDIGLGHGPLVRRTR